MHASSPLKLPKTPTRLPEDPSKLTLNPPKFLQLEIPLPPMEEQSRIIAKIDVIAEKLSQAKSIRVQAENAAQSLIWSICEFYLKKCTTIADSQPLQLLVEPDRGISYGVVQTGKEHDGGILTLRAGDLRWFALKTDNIKKVDPAIEEPYRRTRLHGGELLLRIRGGVGELAVCPPELRDGNVSREIAVIPFRDVVDPRFAMFMLAAPTIQARMRGHVRGTSYVGINLKDVRTIQIPVPDIKQQMCTVNEILALQEKADAVNRLQANISSQLDAMIPSVLHRAFSGGL